jgi:GxxExxY protein
MSSLNEASPFVSKPRLLIRFKTHTLTTPYEADFLCFEQIVLEIKSARETEPKHESQLIHYLRATDFQLGILVNFGHYSDLQYKRFARTKTNKSSS